MTVRHYAFSVRSNGQKIACGTTPGSSMEDAAREVIKFYELKVVYHSGFRADGTEWKNADLYKDRKRVFVSISAHSRVPRIEEKRGGFHYV